MEKYNDVTIITNGIKRTISINEFVNQNPLDLLSDAYEIIIQYDEYECTMIYTVRISNSSSTITLNIPNLKYNYLRANMAVDWNDTDNMSWNVESVDGDYFVKSSTESKLEEHETYTVDTIQFYKSKDDDYGHLWFIGDRQNALAIITINEKRYMQMQCALLGLDSSIPNTTII